MVYLGYDGEAITMKKLERDLHIDMHTSNRSSMISYVSLYLVSRCICLVVCQNSSIKYAETIRSYMAT